VYRDTLCAWYDDHKEKHFMRYTQYRGLAKIRMQTSLAFACMNLKKLASWKQKDGLLSLVFVDFLHIFRIKKIKWNFS